MKTGIVFEGGAFRTIFSCGVMDAMLENKIMPDYMIGVSAGAAYGVSMASGQIGRNLKILIDYRNDKRYVGLSNMVHRDNRSLYGLNFTFDTIPNELVPYDYDAYFQNPTRFEMVTTNCVTGRACYLEEKEDKERLLRIARASSSLPYVCPIVHVDGRPMLDGGIVDSIPVERAMQQGYERNVVVLTRNRGYRKSEKDIKVPHFIYTRYPRLRVVLSRRCQVYNEQLEEIERLEDEGRIIAIRPIKKVVVNRIEKDIKKLTDLYEEGYACAEKVLLPLLDEKVK